jgi:hypothetical protein
MGSADEIKQALEKVTSAMEKMREVQETMQATQETMQASLDKLAPIAPVADQLPTIPSNVISLQASAYENREQISALKLALIRTENAHRDGKAPPRRRATPLSAICRSLVSHGTARTRCRRNLAKAVATRTPMTTAASTLASGSNPPPSMGRLVCLFLCNGFCFSTIVMKLSGLVQACLFVFVSSTQKIWAVNSLFVWLVSHQPAVLSSQNRPATSNQPAVLFSQNKSAPATSQTNRLQVWREAGQLSHVLC